MLATWQLHEFAERQNLELEFELTGNLWEEVILKDVDLLAEEESDFPLRKLAADEVRLHYDLGDFFARRWGSAFEEITVRNAEALVRTQPKKEKTLSEKQAGAEKRRGFLEKLLESDFDPPELRLEDITVRVEDPQGEPTLVLMDSTLTLLPGDDELGKLDIPYLHLPTGATLRDISATTYYSDYRLILRDLRVPEDVAIKELMVDFSEIDEDRFDFRLDGELFEATVSADMLVALQDDAPHLDGTVELSHFNLDRAAELLNLQSLPRGRVDLLDVYVRGNPNKPRELFSRVILEAAEIQTQGVRLDDVRLSAKLEQGSMTLQNAVADTGETHLELLGWASLNREEWKFSDGEAHLFLDLDSPEISQMLDPEKFNLRGQVDLSGRFKITDSKLVSSAGDAVLQDFSWRDYHIHHAQLELSARQNVLYLDDFKIQLTPQNALRATGSVSLEKPNPYKLDTNLDLNDLSALREEVFPEEANPPLPADGQMRLALSSQGELRVPESHTARMRLTGQNLKPLVRAAGGSADAPTPEGEQGGSTVDQLISREDYALQGTARLDAGTLTVPGLRLSLADTDLIYLKGNAPLNLPPQQPGVPILPPQQDLSLQARIVKTEIQQLTGLLGQEAPVTGAVEASLDLSGTMNEPKMELLIAGDAVKWTGSEQIQPAQVLLNAGHDGEKLRVAGKITQPQVEPLQFEAVLNASFQELTSEDADLAEVPLTAQLSLPKTSLQVVKEFMPKLQLTEAFAAARLRAEGNLGNPSVHGEVAVTADKVDLREIDGPAIEAVRIDLQFNGHQVLVEKLSAATAGGRANVTGSIRLPEQWHVGSVPEDVPADSVAAGADIDITPTERPPEGDAEESQAANALEKIPAHLDLQVDGQQLLLFRSQALVLRTNADLQIKGPLASAKVTGNLDLTNSSYYKNINLLPLRLPTGGPSKPKRAQPRKGLNLAGTPFSDWLFDVTIGSADPFLLRGNLARGSLTADGGLKGSGRKLSIVGKANIQEFTLSLPFSTVDVTSGSLTFLPDEQLNPELNLYGRTNIDGREINIYAYGPWNDPETVFSSSPPMTEEQILTLLATGATPSELTGDEGQGAERALIYAAKELYRNIFGTEAPLLNQDMFSGRVSLQSDGINAATGEERTTATLHVNENLQLKSSVETDGNFRGVLQYMVRFND